MLFRSGASFSKSGKYPSHPMFQSSADKTDEEAEKVELEARHAAFLAVVSQQSGTTEMESGNTMKLPT